MSMPRHFIVAASIAGVVGCTAEVGHEHHADADNTQVEATKIPLRGGDVVTGYAGVVDYFLVTGQSTTAAANNCTGTMIAPDVVLTAAHCFDGLGARTSSSGTSGVTIRYFDPVDGIRVVYDGSATWSVLPSYNGTGPTGPGGSNDDLGTLKISGTFADTDYHDYARIYSDFGSGLDSWLLAAGAGIHSYSGSSDNQLRTTRFEVESVETNHIVVDTRQSTSVCKGDSGGPLFFEASGAGTTVPLVAGVLSKMEIDEGSEGDLCTNNDPPHDDSFYCRTHWSRMQWVESTTGLSCDLHTEANRDYRRCFDLPFVEDVPYEGEFELGVSTALVVTLS